MKKAISTVILVLAAIVALSATLFHFQPVNRFRRMPQSYHLAFAHACDQVLHSIDLGTNSFVEVRTKDISVPPILNDVRPVRIAVSLRRLNIMTEGGKISGFGIIWEPSSTASDEWVLSVASDGVDAQVCSVNRKP